LPSKHPFLTTAILSLAVDLFQGVRDRTTEEFRRRAVELVRLRETPVSQIAAKPSITSPSSTGGCVTPRSTKAHATMA
jgi:hypothetical protein